MRPSRRTFLSSGLLLAPELNRLLLADEQDSSAKSRTEEDGEYQQIAAQEEPKWDGNLFDLNHLRYVPAENNIATVVLFSQEHSKDSAAYYQLMQEMAANETYRDRVYFAIVTSDSINDIRNTFYSKLKIRVYADPTNVTGDHFGTKPTPGSIGIIFRSPTQFGSNVVSKLFTKVDPKNVESTIVTPLLNMKLDEGNYKSYKDYNFKNYNLIRGPYFLPTEVPTVMMYSNLACVICKTYFPAMQQLANQYNTSGKVNIVMNVNNPYNDVRGAFAYLNLKLPLIIGGGFPGDDQVIVPANPAFTIFAMKKGKVVGKGYGKDLNKAVKDALARNY